MLRLTGSAKFPEKPVSIKNMNENQLLSIQFPVITETELKSAWLRPTSVKLDSKRVMLINLLVGPIENVFHWHCAIRISNIKKHTVKMSETWMNYEKQVVLFEMAKQLIDVGNGSNPSFFTSKFALHCTVPLSSEELAVLEKFNPNIAAKKIVPFMEKLDE